MDLQAEYRNLDVSHLAVDEVEHELLIRNLLFHFDDHDSVKRRKLKDRMKEEKSIGVNPTAFARTWRTAKEEIGIIRSHIKIIGGILANPKTDARQKEKMRTRIVHYRVRIGQLARATDAQDYLQQITEIEDQIDQIIVTHFTKPSNTHTRTSKTKPIGDKITAALQEVRTEIATLNDTVANLESGDEGDKLDEAVGGVQTNLIDNRKKEIEASKKRTEEILRKLDEYEQGKEINFEYLLPAFRNFVIHTSEQQKQTREKEIKAAEEKKKEMELRIRRKQNLEKVLTELNESLEQQNVAVSKSEKTRYHAPPSDISEEESRTKEARKLCNPKPSLSTRNRMKYQNSPTESSSEANEFSKREERARKSGKKEKRSGRKTETKKRRKGNLRSSSSEETLSVDTEESSESSSLSSDSSTDSTEEERRKKKKNKKQKYRRRMTKRIPVAEWKLRYDGKDDGRKIAEFLKEVKMRCRSEDVSDRELFRSAIHLFSARAKDWYIDGVENGDFRNWSELKKELKREFLPPDIDFQLEIQATNRRQVRGEKFSDYFHEIQKIFQSMTKQLSEKRKFRIVWRNMRHDYKNALTGAEVKTLSKLRRYGRKVDENFSFVQRQTEMPIRHRNQVGEITTTQTKGKSGSSGNNTRVFINSQNQTKPITAGQGKKDQQARVGKEQGKREEVRAIPGDQPLEVQTQSLPNRYQRPPIGTCYNCRKHGHHYVECSETKRLFCRVCGFPDVYTSACPNCPKNKEESA